MAKERNEADDVGSTWLQQLVYHPGIPVRGIGSANLEDQYFLPLMVFCEFHKVKSFPSFPQGEELYNT